MLIYIQGSIFESPAQVLVNTVNTVGVMGKGIALKFKKIYPEMFKNYRYFCEHHKFNIGQLYLYKSPGKWILNFPTKQDWRKPSKLEYIELGLQKFVASYREKQIKSIAFPRLGCGNGGLDFDTQVRPLMDKYLSDLDIDVYVYLMDSNERELEHFNIKEMKKWLNCNIDNISIYEFRSDVINASHGICDVKMLDDGLELNEQYIDYIDLLSFWEYVRNNNVSLQDEVLRKYFNELSNDNLENFRKILKKIEYISMDYLDEKGFPLLVYQPFKKRDDLRI